MKIRYARLSEVGALGEPQAQNVRDRFEEDPVFLARFQPLKATIRVSLSYVGLSHDKDMMRIWSQSSH